MSLRYSSLYRERWNANTNAVRRPLCGTDDKAKLRLKRITRNGRLCCAKQLRIFQNCSKLCKVTKSARVSQGLIPVAPPLWPQSVAGSFFDTICFIKITYKVLVFWELKRWAIMLDDVEKF